VERRNGENLERDSKRVRTGDERKEEVRETEEIMTGRIRYGEGSMRITGVYVNGNMKRKLEEMREWMEQREERVKTIIGEILKREQRGRVAD